MILTMTLTFTQFTISLCKTTAICMSHYIPSLKIAKFLWHLFINNSRSDFVNDSLSPLSNASNNSFASYSFTHALVFRQYSLKFNHKLFPLFFLQQKYLAKAQIVLVIFYIYSQKSPFLFPRIFSNLSN